MSVPTSPPDFPAFFLDRNLGHIKVPAGLRALGVEVVALADRYGIHDGERIDDIDWMQAAAAAGEAVLMTDDAIRRKNPEERRMLIACRLQAFVVNASLPAAETIRRFELSMPAIARVCRRPGPFVYRLHPTEIKSLRLQRD